MLKNKNVFITGGSRGIGLAIVELFLHHGANVYSLSRSLPDNLEELKALAESRSLTLQYLQSDLSDTQAIDTCLKELIDSDLRFDVIINNAGIVKDKFFFALKEEDWDNVFNVNLMGPVAVLKRLIPSMVKQKGGSIINMSSIIGLVGNVGQSNYAASKAAIIGLTKSLAKELAVKKIRVNAIAPGFIETDMTNKLNPKFKEKYLANIPLGRFGQPQDVANLCLFLASDLSTYITGQIINISGGLLI